MRAVGSSVSRPRIGTPVLFLYAANTECKVRRMRDLFGLGDRSSQCKIESTLPARLPEVAAVVLCIIKAPEPLQRRPEATQHHRLRRKGRNAGFDRNSYGDPRSFARSGPHALADIASAAAGSAPAIDRIFAGVTPLQSAGQDEVSFLDDAVRRRFEGWPVLPRCFILCRHLVPEFIPLRWSTATREWTDPPRSAPDL
jgi:hypothetical protein